MFCNVFNTKTLLKALYNLIKSNIKFIADWDYNEKAITNQCTMQAILFKPSAHL